MLNNHNFFVYLYENLFVFHNEPRQQRIFCWSICFKAIDSEINHVRIQLYLNINLEAEGRYRH